MTDRQNRAYDDYVNGMKYSEIARKHGVSISAVKMWALRDWKRMSASAVTEKVTKLQPRKKGGANNLKHGAYAKITWDTLTDDEVIFLSNLDKSYEKVLSDEIDLYTIRERRILQRIKKLRDSGDDTLFVVSARSRKVEVGNRVEKQPIKTEATVKKLSKSAEWNKLEDILTKIQTGKMRYFLGNRERNRQELIKQNKINELRQVFITFCGSKKRLFFYNKCLTNRT